MSTFERDNYQWRETYFVLFESGRRPSLENVRKTIAALGENFQLIEPTAEEDGGFESVTVLAPDDFAAVDISYLSGEDASTESTRLAKELGSSLDAGTRRRLLACDARLDLMHFEQVMEEAGAEPDEAFDPSALLMVLEALVSLTDGIGVDPQSGSIM
ncbi:MAG: hypothetical protein AB7O62_03270 [Pirellulales bacterium]